MKIEQVFQIVNALQSQFLGQTTELTATDNTKLVDVGKELLDATSIDNYVRKLVDHIGKVVFVNRPYSGRAPSLKMESWEYGSIMEKIDAGIPKAQQNPTWALENGQRVEQDTFVAPTDVKAKFWNNRTTFEVPFSFADRQVKSAFSNVTQLNAFFSMIETMIQTGFTIDEDALIMSTIANGIAVTYNNNNANRSINLLAKYKAHFPSSTVTAETCLYDTEFLKFASKQFKLYSDYMTVASSLFNIGGRIRHTPKDRQKIVMLSDFASSADTYLQSDTFHNEFTALPNADKVAFWQGSGVNSFGFEDISSIYVNANSDNSGTGVSTKVSGILGCIFDREFAAVNCYDKRVPNHYNAHGEFVNMWYKEDAQYFNDFNENFVLFYVANPTPTPETQSLKK